MAAFEESIDQMTSDEAGTASDDRAHVSILLLGSVRGNARRRPVSARRPESGALDERRKARLV
jgi:hypothetical protein